MRGERLTMKRRKVRFEKEVGKREENTKEKKGSKMEREKKTEKRETDDSADMNMAKQTKFRNLTESKCRES